MSANDVLGFDLARSMLTKLENSHDQPFVIYLTGESDDAKRAEAILNGAFTDERIGIAAQVFCMIKASGTDIDATHPFARHVGGKTLPRVAVFAGDGTKIGQLEGNVTSSDVFELMQEAFDRSYEGNLERVMKSYRKLLTTMATLRAKKELLDDDYLTAETRAKEKTLEKELAGLEKQAESLRSQKKKILELPRRSST